ncbi:BREX-1 system adenine-specific DNA-methyltransferase PglX, partial [Microbacterium aquilitoris]|uniref:BREX-1 system adenine-specific DNA-methyltransferase PglX n=1 Tax=Microbacterium aquilitoris TaxID=3067307 RepID=UPI002891B6E0
SQRELLEIPGSPFAYWLSGAMRLAFAGTTEQREKNFAKGISRDPLSNEVRVAQGITTGANARYLRNWWEVDHRRSNFDRGSGDPDSRRWVAADKGGEFRRWYGNNDFVIDWQDDGKAIIESPASTPRNITTAFQPSLACSKITSGDPAFRYHERGFVFTDAAVSLTGAPDLEAIEGFLNSATAREMLAALAPTLNFEVGQIRSLPRPAFDGSTEVARLVRELRDESRRDWDSFETSWDFTSPPWLGRPASGDAAGEVSLSDHLAEWSARWTEIAHNQQVREEANNRTIAKAFGLEDEVPHDVPLQKVSLTRNVAFRHGGGKTRADYDTLERSSLVVEMISYAVGCIMGRYSLDEPGLILADAGATVQDYLTTVPSPTLRPDADNVIPFVDDGWFDDDIVERFRHFLRVVFGTEHFEDNVRFIEQSLGVKSLRDYFVSKAGKSKFYDDHVQRYKKRPIYWMFSSPKGSFNALIYMHRYNPSTVSTVLNEYLREYRAKLEVALTNAERAGVAGSSKDQKEADRLRIVLAELSDYEHDVLYPLATQQISIDLDDGVKANYPKFYPALRKIVGLEAAE